MKRPISLLLLRLLAYLGRKFGGTIISRSMLLTRVHAALSMWLFNSNEIKVGGFRVRFDPRDRVIAKKLALYGGFEEAEINILCSLSRPGDCVLDVGANIGLHSLYLSRSVGPGGRVIAVEPDPDNLKLLSANLEANGCDNVTVLPYAFGNEEGWVGLFQSSENRGNLSIVDIDGNKDSVSVYMRRGEDVLKELGARPSLAKIDVEGAESIVISGLGSYLPASLMFEFIPQNIRAFGEDPRALLDTLIESDYLLELIDPSNGERKPGSSSEILSMVEGMDRTYNILATLTKTAVSA